MTATTTQLARNLSIEPRRWYQRGWADHGWLKTFHTFSFASYHDDRHVRFSNLRVINEDRVSPGTGFGTHPHREAEIFSIVLSGSLEHRDSMGNVEKLSRGDVQFTSAGTGIRHSERNGSGEEEVHFLQIWYNPDVRGLKPTYYTAHIPDEEKRDNLKTLIRPFETFDEKERSETGDLDRGRAIPSHASLVTRSSILSPGSEVQHTFGEDSGILEEGKERWAYIHLAQTSGYKDPEIKEVGFKGGEAILHIANGDVRLNEGDGAYIKGGKVGEKLVIRSVGAKDAEFVLFDLRPE
ncbi:RmlC-like cupin [Violaceomyces palustris]|uniref:RmlC-like cupin n=1 Tax=Violaceomyces palustris TaxID=1673888 RepID=A0ACD0P3E9_9BASI|nr:RmlC-like cupin [Violaceomyces palustris]